MKCKKRYGLLVIIGLFAVGLLIAKSPLRCFENYAPLWKILDIGRKTAVPSQFSRQDHNRNGIADPLDLVQGARREVEQRTVYDGSYYKQGYPPEGKGACTDVIWRAFQAAGYNLRQMVDEDIRSAPGDYGGTGANPDSAIDFRRVRNLQVFFQHRGQVLTNEVKPGEVDNLIEWQPGDIVTFAAPAEHIGIISDRRRRDGVPLVIHNAGPRASEADILINWPTAITGHFRFFSG